jgi:nitrate reductase delta subunit
MRLLKVLAHLINYPTADVRQHQADLAMEISNAREIPPAMRLQLLEALETIYRPEIMDAQEEYGLLFDQGRSMSLHIFEHVHGESRDRGQAMVDLMDVYETNGFQMDAMELPDFLPLFLEYLSNRPDIEAREWLADVSHIIARLCARLHERALNGQPVARHYALLLEALLLIAGAEQQLADARQEVAEETPDNTLEAIDKEWEETAVTFSTPDKSCGLERKPSVNSTQPLHWVDATASHNSQTEGYLS